MSFLKDIINNNKDALIEQIFDDELRVKVVTAINDNVNVPIISEKTEGKIIEALYDSVEEVVKEVIREAIKISNTYNMWDKISTQIALKNVRDFLKVNFDLEEK